MELPNGFEAVLVHRNYTDPGAGVVLARRTVAPDRDEWVCWCMNTSNDSFFWGHYSDHASTLKCYLNRVERCANYCNEQGEDQ
mgnify:FL=1